ncbi:MAG TPA: hypothetical protein VFS43_40080 [Polyangiaceae bacterium]|nr:hypothetical protein [Polyangiaceae bacterium]
MSPNASAPLPLISIGAEARGFIAIGNVATGVVAIGSTFAVGVVAIGTNALGSLFALGLNAGGLVTLSLANGCGVVLIGAVNGAGVFGGAGANMLRHPAVGALWAAASALTWLALHAGPRRRRGAGAAFDETLSALGRGEPRSARVRARLAAAAPGEVVALGEEGGATRLFAEAAVVARARELLASSRRPEVELDVVAADELPPGGATPAYRRAPTTMRVLSCRGVEPLARPGLAARGPEFERASLLASAALALAAALASLAR